MTWWFEVATKLTIYIHILFIDISILDRLLMATSLVLAGVAAPGGSL